jgi:hypothetical protein
MHLSKEQTTQAQGEIDNDFRDELRQTPRPPSLRRDIVLATPVASGEAGKPRIAEPAARRVNRSAMAAVALRAAAYGEG